MSEMAAVRTRCWWCKFDPDARMLFVFLVLIALLAVIARNLAVPTARSASTHTSAEQIRVVPMAAEPKKHEKEPNNPSKPHKPVRLKKEPTKIDGSNSCKNSDRTKIAPKLEPPSTPEESPIPIDHIEL